MIGCRCVLLAPGFAPQTTISFECTKSIGSLDNMSPNTRSQAAELVPAQIVCSISGQPNRSNRYGIKRFLSIRADDELYKYGRTLSGPCSPIALDIFPATRAIASSQVALRNPPEPFAPVRIKGVIIRSFEYTRIAWCFTFLQIHPSVNGFACSPIGAASMSTILPSSTVTSREHESGQSSGQAVMTFIQDFLGHPNR